jgi:hypothetical protein
MEAVVGVSAVDDSADLGVAVGDAAGGGETVTTTEDGPFWVEGRGWTPATQLQADDQLRENCALLVLGMTTRTVMECSAWGLPKKRPCCRANANMRVLVTKLFAAGRAGIYMA